MDRRRFLATSAAAVGGLLTTGAGPVSAQSLADGALIERLTGADLSGWTTVVGDGVYAKPGHPDVARWDVMTRDLGTHSELIANVYERGIMAHNIAFKRLIDDTLMDQTHRCSYEFRLTSMPTLSDYRANGQTVEGGFFIWDGAKTRRDHGLGFQWVINPWDPDFGSIRKWSMSNADWKKSTFAEPDLEWHRVDISLEPKRNKATIAFDGVEADTSYTRRKKPDYWGNEMAARLQVETISLDPGPLNSGPSNTIEVRNWSWERFE